MKKIAFAFCILFMMACEADKPKDYVTFSGTILNKNSDSVEISSRTFSKSIKVHEDGTFSDTLKVEPGLYSFYDGTEGTSIFLKNGYNIKMTLDTEKFDETIQYEGEGAEHNNFLAKKALLQELLFSVDFDAMDAVELNDALESARREMTNFFNNASTIDTMVTNDSRDRFDASLELYANYYGQIIALRTELPKGSKSPTWQNYENFNGGTTSLADLKGKYVYVDVWATWCGPCKVEIPHLKKLETEMHDKNIAFVSMSIDNDRTHKGSWEQARLDWKAMVKDKELGGIQIWAPKGWESDFVQAYKIKGIPRFILIDPAGNVVDPNAPKPSSPRLKEILATLL